MNPLKQYQTDFYIILPLIVLLSSHPVGAIAEAVTPSAPRPQAAELSSVSVTNSSDALLVSVTITGAFGDAIRKAVDSGVPTTFSFFIKLKRIRTFWKNKEIRDVTLTHTIKYNNLKNEFTVLRSWDGNGPVSVKSFAVAKELMSEIRDYRLIPFSGLESDNRYQISIKAKLSQIDLPFYLKYLFLLSPDWDFETRWHYIDVNF